MNENSNEIKIPEATPPEVKMVFYDQNLRHILIQDQQLSFNIDSFADANLLLLSALRHFMDMQAAMPGETKEHVYDAVNDAVSAILCDFMPEENFLQEEADDVIRQQNEELQKSFQKLREENPRLYRRNLKAYNAAVGEQRARVLQAQQAAARDADTARRLTAGKVVPIR